MLDDREMNKIKQVIRVFGWRKTTRRLCWFLMRHLLLKMVCYRLSLLECLTNIRRDSIINFVAAGTLAAKMKKVASNGKEKEHELTSVFESFTPHNGMEGNIERIWIADIATYEKGKEKKKFICDVIEILSESNGLKIQSDEKENCRKMYLAPTKKIHVHVHHKSRLNLLIVYLMLVNPTVAMPFQIHTQKPKIIRMREIIQAC